MDLAHCLPGGARLQLRLPAPGLARRHRYRDISLKAAIQPECREVQVQCSCGHQFMVRSTYAEEQLHIEVCSKCHPFYTGQQKIIDTEGRVEKFRRRYGIKG